MIKLYTKFQNNIASRQSEVRDEGATMVEYGLIVTSIALVVILGVRTFGTALSVFFTTLAGQF